MKLDSVDVQDTQVARGFLGAAAGSSDGAIKVQQGDDDLISECLAGSISREHRMRVFDYWRSLRVNGELPLWSSFDLMDVYKSAGFTVIKDVIDQGSDFVNRFWGTRMSDVVGADHTGRGLRNYYDEGNIDIIRSLYNLPLESRQAMIFLGDFWFVAGKEFVSYEALCLPCTDESGEIIRLVTVFDYEEEFIPVC